MNAYRERLRVPASWWLLAVALAFSLWLAYHHAYGPRVSVPVGLVALWLAAAGLLAYGRATVAVQADALLAGAARLPLWAVGEVTRLDAAAARAARGPDADPRAYLLLRGYVPEAVSIAVDDPADPVPYWLISTRHPDRLAAALTAARDRVRPA